jgi:hypothetical protein
MITATVQQGQSLMDMAIQHTGDMAGLFEIAKANGISITTEILPGARLNIPPALNKDAVKYFAEKQITIATDEEISEGAAQNGGIGFMQIGYDFIVT